MMAMEIDTFTNSHDDFLVLVAAGNDGPGTGTVGTPATAKNILAVGSTNNAGGASQIVVSMRVMYASTETTLEITPSTFGPSLTDMAPITNAMAVSSPLDGCTAVGSSLSGKIALVQRGTCNFDTKVRNAQNAGAVAVIVFNHLEGADVLMGGGTDAVHVTIPSAFIGLSDGTLLQAAAASGVTITLPVFSSSADAVQAHHTLASYSSRGPTNELRIKPDVVCPGTNIKSAHADGITTSNNCNFAAMSGTSMATPLCAGAAALVREYFVKGYSAAGVKDPVKAVDPSAALVKAVMIHSAQSVQTENGYETDYPNVQTGYGRVELSSILRFSDSAFGSVYKNRQTLAHGGHALFCFRVGASASKDLRVSLVWTDPAGDPSSMRSLVNDLDLIVHGPGDALFQGNTLKQTDETHGTYAVRDSLNNAEQVRVQNPVAGVYAVRVIGRDIPTGPQNFALVASASSMQEAPVAECAALQCPRSCSGIGQCLASGVCSCPLTHMGPDCSKAYKTLHLGSDATQTTQLSVTWLGMSYYVFQILDGGSFVLTLSPGIQGSTADADFYLAKDRLPTIADYDGVIADENSAGNFRSVGNARGIWVLGLQAYSGDVKVLASIIPGGTGGGTGDVDEGTGGGGTGGGGSVSGNCTEPCKCGRYTSTSGALADGSGPSNYSPNANCWWIIAPDSADMSNVTLTFTHFNTEFGYDTLNFYSCDDPWCSPEGLNMLGEMSGMPAVPLSIFSSTGYMLITFSSDDSISFGGFEGTWAMNMAGGDSSFYDGGPTTTPCSCGYSNATVGTIEDGSGDVNYPNNAVCRWIIEGVDVTTGVIESGTRVAIRFLEFVTEMEYDFVTIKECDSLTWTGIDGEPLTTPTCLQPRQIARISGFIDPGVYYYALTGIMEVIFTSDATVTRQGFVGEWTVSTSDEIIPSVCTPPCECGELTAPRGMLVDGSSEGTYPNNADCTWTIVVSGAEWIKLSFVKFELELNYDFLKIYQCFDSADCADSQGGTEIAHLTGVSIPKQLTAVGGMRVHFTSDSTINKQGFTAVWTSSLDNDDGNNNDDDDESEGGSLGDECGQNRTTCEADLFCNYDENKSGSCERCSDCPNCFECGLPHRGALDCTRKCSGQMHWPYPPADSFWQSCALPGNWSRLKPDAYAGILLSGGLGQRIIPGVFDTWACHYAHQCVRRLDNASYVLDGSPGSAQSASECHAACQQNGFGCGFGVELLDEYRGSFNALSCMQTCMMRVNGVDLATCIERVDHVASGTECVVTIDDRRYHVCGDSALNATICDVAPTVASGRAGCSMGAAPRRDEVDPFCWVYNEISGQFEAFGYGSEVGLL